MILALLRVPCIIRLVSQPFSQEFSQTRKDLGSKPSLVMYGPCYEGFVSIKPSRCALNCHPCSLQAESRRVLVSLLKARLVILIFLIQKEFCLQRLLTKEASWQADPSAMFCLRSVLVRLKHQSGNDLSYCCQCPGTAELTFVLSVLLVHLLAVAVLRSLVFPILYFQLCVSLSACRLSEL